VSNHTIHALEASLIRAGVVRRSVPGDAKWRTPAKVLSRLGLIRPFIRRRENLVLVPSMGFSEYRLVPFGYIFETVLYVFDCWPKDYRRWIAYFRRHRPRVTFFSARDSAAYFRHRIPGMEAIWMPEATDPGRYRTGPQLTERSLDVLELGRRYSTFHEAVREPLRRLGRSHRFESQPGQIIFPTFRELVDGLAATRISICFPSSLTHPARSGSVETVTHRYFESMASRCVVVGKCPGELADLFGYDPVIPADMGDPSTQIVQILGDLGAYQPLVDQNRARLLEVATWDVRVAAILTTLANRGVVGA
jgi:hypothetical protein